MHIRLFEIGAQVNNRLQGFLKIKLDFSLELQPLVTICQAGTALILLFILGQLQSLEPLPLFFLLLELRLAGFFLCELLLAVCFLGLILVLHASGSWGQ